MCENKSIFTESVGDFIRCYFYSVMLLVAVTVSHEHTQTHTSLTIQWVALSCWEMCNGKDKWRIKLRWQDWACMCLLVFACVCVYVSACVHCTTDQQTICSSPLNEQSKQQESRLSPNLGSLYWWAHTNSHIHTILHCLIWLSLIENRGKATFLDLSPTSVTEKVWNTISKLLLSSALQSHLTKGSQMNQMCGN